MRWILERFLLSPKLYLYFECFPTVLRLVLHPIARSSLLAEQSSARLAGVQSRSGEVGAECVEAVEASAWRFAGQCFRSDFALMYVISGEFGKFYIPSRQLRGWLSTM